MSTARLNEPSKSSMESGELKRAAGGTVPVDTKVVINKTYKAIIPFLFLTVLWTYLDRFNLAFSALSFKQYLHLDNAQYGLGSGVFFLGYVVTMLPANLLILKIGAPNLLALIIVCWGTAGAATGALYATVSVWWLLLACLLLSWDLSAGADSSTSENYAAAVRNVWQFYLARFCLGLAEGGTFPGTFYHASLFFTTKELTLGYSAVVGALAAAALLQMDGVAGMPGWQWLFIIEGLLTIPTERDWLQQRQDNIHIGAVAKSEGRGTTIVGAHPLRPGLIDWRLWYLGVVWFLVETTIFGVLFWAPLLLDAMLSNNFSGTNPKAATPAHQSNAELVTIVMITIAWSSKKHKERHLHGGIPVFISGVAFLVMPIVLEKGGPIPGIIMLIIAGCGAWSLWGPIWSWPATFLLGRARASGSALFNTLGVFGGFVGPYLIGALSNHGSFTRPMYVLGCFNVVAALMMFVFRAPDWVDEGIDDYAEDHSHVGDRSHTPLRAEVANGNTADGAVPIAIKH
ncbi:hypothetical protein WJX81_005015 [Elliptochloris bilobata]|uniref:Uncharacterized protein n=1 Tax=Elliptochloris bilobata TaxID=381761 RepID=A0AAW1RGU9_9CHLO